MRDIVAAIDYFRRAMAADPEYANAWGGLAMAYAVARGSSRTPRAAQLVAARSDPAARATVLGAVEDAQPPEGRGAFAYGRVGELAVYGDYDGALPMLEESLARREFDLPMVTGLPPFEPLRNEPRFRRILGALGLTEFWEANPP